MSKIYIVTISDRKMIPFLNTIGPITFPVPLTEERYNTLVNLGFRVTVVEEREAAQPAPVFDNTLTNDVDTNTAPPLLTEEDTADTSGVTLTANDPLPDEQGEETEGELLILTNEEIDGLEPSDLREYILQFEGALTSEQEQAAKARQTKKAKLVEIAKAISKN